MGGGWQDKSETSLKPGKHAAQSVASKPYTVAQLLAVTNELSITDVKLTDAKEACSIGGNTPIVNVIICRAGSSNSRDHATCA